jgi:hypothetical protein
LPVFGELCPEILQKSLFLFLIFHAGASKKEKWSTDCELKFDADYTDYEEGFLTTKAKKAQKGRSPGWGPSSL